MWALMVQYDYMTQKLIELYNQKGRTSEADALNSYKANLINKDNGDSMTFWQDLADNNRLAGSHQAILDGTKQWDASAEEFKTI